MRQRRPLKNGSTAKLTRELLLSFACDDQERAIARHLGEAGLQHISRFPTPEERQFAFRCFWVPHEMIWVFEEVFSSVAGWFQHIPQIALVVAHGRMLNEMCAWGHDPRTSWWYPNAAAKGCVFWMRRYDAHLAAIDASFRYWVRRSCPDSCNPRPELAAAARYGFIQRVDVEGLPYEGLLAEMKKRDSRRQGNVGSESEMFHKHANPREANGARWDYPDIDLWLIEIWPLVDQYGWTYRDVHDLAFTKFGGDKTFVNTGVLSTPAGLKERCKLLKLRISPLARKRSGRPKKCDDPTGLARFGGEVCEEFSTLVGSMEQEIQQRSSSAFRGLAEIAVNIEPFTRLMAGTSKESCSFAVPNLRKRGKSLSATPPFFVVPSS